MLLFYQDKGGAYLALDTCIHGTHYLLHGFFGKLVVPVLGFKLCSSTNIVGIREADESPATPSQVA